MVEGGEFRNQVNDSRLVLVVICDPMRKEAVQSETLVSGQNSFLSTVFNFDVVAALDKTHNLVVRSKPQVFKCSFRRKGDSGKEEISFGGNGRRTRDQVKILEPKPHTLMPFLG